MKIRAYQTRLNDEKTEMIVELSAEQSKELYDNPIDGVVANDLDCLSESTKLRLMVEHIALGSKAMELRTAIKTLSLAERSKKLEESDFILDLIKTEINKAKAKFPNWPTDPTHAAAIVAEESGELVKACLELSYEPHKTNIASVRDEAVQVAAMAIRFLQSIDHYEFKPAEQHTQP